MRYTLCPLPKKIRFCFCSLHRKKGKWKSHHQPVNKISKRLRSVLKIVLLLGIVLSLHLWAMANHNMADNATIQLSKLNFDKSADENDIAIVGQALRSKDGVKSVHYFPEQKSMVVAYNNLHLTGKEVYCRQRANIHLQPSAPMCPKPGTRPWAAPFMPI